MVIYDFSINGAFESLVLPVKNLRFSWKVNSEIDGSFQKCFSLFVYKNDDTKPQFEFCGNDDSVQVEFKDLVLDYETKYTFKLEIISNNDEKASFTKSYFTEINDWNGAKWVKNKDRIPGWSPYIRTKFETEDEKEIADVKIYAVGLGVGEYYVNGEKIADGLCEPTSTNYEKTILYRCYDATKFVTSGKNCFVAQLGEGFYAQRQVWGGMVYGDECLLARIVITYKDGSKQVIVSDESFKSHLSQITQNSIYGGEVYDGRLEIDDFAKADSSDDTWMNCEIDNTPKGVLTPCLMGETKIIRELPAISVETDCGNSDGAWIFDLGENFAGIYEAILPPSPCGHVYVFRCVETLDDKRHVDHRSIGAGATQVIQQEIYISSGKPNEVYRPRFAYHGFRYVEMTGMHDFSKGYGTMPDKSMIKGLQTSTELKQIGEFTTENNDVDKLQKLMINTFRSNYHGYPEDCPAREKCGWLGDAEIVCNWGLYTYDLTTAYEKYLSDIKTTKEVYGKWQMIAPGKRTCGGASPLWGCAQIIIPYYMWKYTGNKSVIEDNIDLMREWVTYQDSKAVDLVISDGLGDWDPPSTKERTMPVPHSSTLMYYEINEKMAEIERTFGYSDGMSYHDKAEKIKAKFIETFYDKEKHSYLYWGTNGAALSLGIYPEGEKDLLVKAMVKQIIDEDYEMPTGIYGNKYLLPALIDNGYGDVAMEYMFTRKHFSFGTMIDDDATTIWECLKMKNFDGSKKSHPSYNHPMHGGCLYINYAYVAGIEPIEPGFKKFSIKPRKIKGLENFKASYNCPYGMIEVTASTINDKTVYDITVPFGTICEATINNERRQLSSGKYTF